MDEHTEKETLDFVAVGDIVTDAFIELSDVRIDTEPDPGDLGHKEVCFRLGDKIPFEEVVVVPAVGNSPNAAISASRLGLKVGLVTDMGDDRDGNESLEQLKKESVDLSNVRVHEGMKSNYHYVLRYGPERTILVKHQEYEYAFPGITPPPKWMYLSSLAENSLGYHEEIVGYLEAHKETKLAFQPGTFQISLGYEKLERMYKISELFFCNKEEAQKILGSDSKDIMELLRLMHDRGPKIVVITDGPEGAYTFDGTEIWHMPMYPDPKEPVDRTGAGDSFSSTFTSALALGKSVPEALELGPINSMSVVQFVGAQKGLLTHDELEKYLESRPEGYRSEKLA
ncbi:MAG: carbohydrate kinase family protein [Candidatus Paceibacterota bacterium]